MKRFKNILVVVDEETPSSSIARAIGLAKSNKAKLTLVEILPILPNWAGTKAQKQKWAKIQIAVRKEHAERLELLANRYRSQISIETKILEGKKFLQIIREALRSNHDLVMKDIELGRSLRSRLLGSEDMRLLRKCPCPIMLTERSGGGTIDRILAAVDFDPVDNAKYGKVNVQLNRQILEMAITLAHIEESELDIVHVFPVIGEGVLYSGRSGLDEEEIAEHIEDIRAKYGEDVDELLKLSRSWAGSEIFDTVKIEKHILKGSAVRKIPEHAKKRDVDLIVMGTVGRTGVSGYLIGNTAETILNNLECSVLAFKPEGFVSPVTLDDDEN